MKITCQACQAKYTIADEKVVGKVVKIRCKKCGASIVVNGTQTSPDATQPTASGGIFDTAPQGSTSAMWTVNVADGDQRTMTEAEIVAAYGANVVTGETFCWKEGMADWLPLQEIAPLLAACTAMRSASSRREEEDAPTRIHDPSAGGAGAGASAASPAMAASDRRDGNGMHVAARPPAPAAPVAARRAGGRGAVADLFGAVAQAGGEDEVLTSAPPGVPQAHEAQKTTGARNESSVLFEVQEKGNAAPPSMVGTNEASGLIDIRQLSAQMHASADESSKKKSRVDDIMNLGGGGAFSPSLGAPILSAPSLEQYYSQPPPSMVGVAGSEAPPPKSKALAFLAVSAGLFFLIAAASVALWLVRGRGPLAADEGTAANAREQVPMASALGTPTQSPSARTAAEAPQASVAPEAKISAPATGASAAKEPPTKEAKESTPAPPKEPKATTTNPQKEASLPTGAPAAEFNMGEARSRLASIAGGVQSCKRGETSGSGKVEIVFAPSGAVQSANLISGSPFDGSVTGKCVEARFRGARVPAFGGSPFTVTKSFSIN